MTKNDQFITRTKWAENWSTTKHMPGRYFFQDASFVKIGLPSGQNLVTDGRVDTIVKDISESGLR